LAKKKAKEKRVASVDAMGILTRDLKQIVLWIVISIGIVAVLAVLQRMLWG